MCYNFLIVPIYYTVWSNKLIKLCFNLHTGKYFSQCQTHTVEFDECIKNAINNVRPYFTTGIFYYIIIILYFT